MVKRKENIIFKIIPAYKGWVIFLEENSKFSRN